MMWVYGGWVGEGKVGLWVSEDDVVYGSVRAMWAVCGGELCWCW